MVVLFPLMLSRLIVVRMLKTIIWTMLTVARSLFAPSEH
jgi:hypothetical protein